MKEEDFGELRDWLSTHRSNVAQNGFFTDVAPRECLRMLVLFCRLSSDSGELTKEVRVMFDAEQSRSGPWVF